MTATREDVNRWIASAKEEGYKYIISVCDTFDYSDYPVYCRNDKELCEIENRSHNEVMQRVNEIIRINEDGTVDENLKIDQI